MLNNSGKKNSGGIRYEQPYSGGKIYIGEKETDKAKDGRYVAVFIAQTILCLLILAAIFITRYINRESFLSISGAVDGLSSNNVTMADLSSLISERLRENDAVATFFRIEP